MQWALLGSFLVMGFLGSWHCGLMCGPLCSNFKSKNDFLLYQFGRLTSYLVIGTLLYFGAQFFLNVESRGLKLLATFIYGGLFVYFGLSQLDFIKTKLVNTKYSKLRFNFLNKNKKMIQKFPLVLGLFSGLLPCAWLYSFLFLSTQMNSIEGAWALIFIFWFTALPAFAAFTGFMQNLIKASPLSHRKISGVILVLSGVFSLIGHWI